jgi:hypothetical protein
MTDDHMNAQTNPPPPQPNGVLLRLEAFVGAWEWQASIDAQPIGRGSSVFG